MRLSKRGEYGLRAMIMLATPGLMGTRQLSKFEKSRSGRKSLPSFSNRSSSPLQVRVIAQQNGCRRRVSSGEACQRDQSRPHRTNSGRPVGACQMRQPDGLRTVRLPDEETCGLRLAMGDVRNSIAKILDGTSLEDVTRRVSKVRKSLKSG